MAKIKLHTTKQLRVHRRMMQRDRQRAENYLKPQPFSRSDEYRFGVRSKRQ